MQYAGFHRQYEWSRHEALTPSLVKAADALGNAGALIPAMVLGFLLWHLLGLPWTTWGMVRNGQIRWYAALLATLGTIGAFFGSGTRLETVGWEVLGISFGLLAMSLLRATPEQAPAPRSVPVPAPAWRRRAGRRGRVNGRRELSKPSW